MLQFNCVLNKKNYLTAEFRWFAMKGLKRGQTFYEKNSADLKLNLQISTPENLRMCNLLINFGRFAICGLKKIRKFNFATAEWFQEFAHLWSHNVLSLNSETPQLRGQLRDSLTFINAPASRARYILTGSPPYPKGGFACNRILMMCVIKGFYQTSFYQRSRVNVHSPIISTMWKLDIFYSAVSRRKCI